MPRSHMTTPETAYPANSVNKATGGMAATSMIPNTPQTRYTKPSAAWNRLARSLAYLIVLTIKNDNRKVTTNTITGFTA